MVATDLIDAKRHSDFPDIVVLAINTFNRLGDRVYSEIGYIGKDYTNLKLYMDLYGIDTQDEDFFLEFLEWLDARAIKKSAEQLKREYDKIKRRIVANASLKIKIGDDGTLKILQKTQKSGKSNRRVVNLLIVSQKSKISQSRKRRRTGGLSSASF